MVSFLCPSPHYVVPTTMIDVIRHLGLTSGLKLCLDAGDVSSYSGSGQIWNDLSGGNYFFTRGANTNASSDDPTFNGVAGRQSASEYWSFDGGDAFFYNTTNPGWIENLHKDNAIWSLATWFYYVAGGANTFSPIFLTADSGADVGFLFAVDHDNNLSFFIVNNGVNITSPFALTASFNAVVTQNAWNFLAWSYTESTGAVNARVNGETGGGTIGSYTSPSSGSATLTARIGLASSAVGKFPSGARLNSLAMWEGAAITADQKTALYNATKAKFGL